MPATPVPNSDVAIARACAGPPADTSGYVLKRLGPTDAERQLADVDWAMGTSPVGDIGYPLDAEGEPGRRERVGGCDRRSPWMRPTG